MITLHRIDWLFSKHQHARLYRELIAARPEAFLELDDLLSRVVPIAALGIIRLEELNQAHTSTYRRLLNVLLTSQQPNGGWGDVMTTAIALRALLCAGGEGPAVDRGLRFLASLQKEDALWPREPLHRMPGDPLASAFVLMQLGDRSSFRQAVDFGAAVAWFATHRKSLDELTRRLWDHAAVRCCAAANRDRAMSLFIPATRPAA